MPNILITNVCYRACTFCFARQRLGDGAQEGSTIHMSRENIRYVMDFLDRSNDKNLRLLGGEPSQHPEFIEIVKEALERNFHVHIFTNGMMTREKSDYLGGLTHEQFSALCNVSPQATLTEAQKDDVEYFLSKVGHKAGLGITVTSEDIEYEYLIDTIKRHNLGKQIRVGIAQPIVGVSNEYLPVSNYKTIGTAILAMARVLIEHDIMIGFDCGMTMCMFSEEELGGILTSSRGFDSICTPVMDIGPNLDVWNCFPLSEVLNTRLDQFDTVKELSEYYTNQLLPYKQFGCMPECMDCAYLRRKQCSGGCVAHTMLSFNRLPPKKGRPPQEKPAT
jgi:radical SAM protein with 4Fe4S-binding SPASM domain